MKRKMIKIDENLCNGCGLCATACHEGAIGMVNGKARLLREDFCDGLGDCLPVCPVNAITFELREAPAYDAEAVRQAQNPPSTPKLHACPGAAVRSQAKAWPLQIQLVPVNAPFLNGANLVIAADCTAFAYPQFHSRFQQDCVTVIGCPKLDDCAYADKLTEMLRQNDIKSVHVIRMEVPCCGGIERAVRQAVAQSGKDLPCRASVVSIDGRVLKD